jgi:hypothetical protein
MPLASRPGVWWGRLAVGSVYLGGAVLHLTLSVTSPRTYASFAEGALFPFVRTEWRDVFMANPASWARALALGELAIGTAVLLGGIWTRLGYLAAIGFHVALMLFGWGFWLWSVPALAFLTLLAVREGRCPEPSDARPETQLHTAGGTRVHTAGGTRV